MQIPITDLQKSAQMREAAKAQKMSNICSYAANLFAQNFSRSLDGKISKLELANECIEATSILFKELDSLVEKLKNEV